MSLMIASAIFSAYGSIQAGKARSAEARAQAEQLRVQKAQAKLTAMQEHNIRSMNLRTLNNINTSFTGVLGRDSGSDRSLKAIRDRATSEARVAEDRARSQFIAEQGQRTMGIQLANMRASNARRMALINAGSTLLTAGAKYSTVAPKSTGYQAPVYTSADFRGFR